jgi:hypothetical protein
MLAETQLPFGGLAFFLWVGVFSYTMVAQFWALAADSLRTERRPGGKLQRRADPTFLASRPSHPYGSRP